MMKKDALILFLMTALILSIGSIAKAAPDPLEFTGTTLVNVVDGSGDGLVDILVGSTPGFFFGSVSGSGFSALASGSIASGAYDFAVMDFSGAITSLSLDGATQRFSDFQGTSGGTMDVYGVLALTWSTVPVSVDILLSLTPGTTLTSAEGFSPVPIPASVYLMGAGLIGLVGLARRRRVSLETDL